MVSSYVFKENLEQATVLVPIICYPNSAYPKYIPIQKKTVFYLLRYLLRITRTCIGTLC